jgi:hypothetical protein
MPGVAFPPVGRLGLPSPPSSVLCSTKTATLPVSGRFACHSRPDTLRASVGSWCPRRARVRVEAPRARQGFWSSGPPFPGVAQGDRWLSQVPELPLEIHAPLSDPGGVPSARQSVSGIAAFRCQEPSAFPSAHLRVILVSTIIKISGLHHAACILVPSSFVRPLLGVHVEFPTDRLARRWSGGI